MRGNTTKQNFKVLIALMVIIILIVISYNNLYSSSDDNNLDENDVIDNSNGTSVKMWNEDIDYLTDQLKAKHKDLYHNISKKDFNNQVDDLKDNLEYLTDEKIKVEIKKIIASIGDTHTNIRYEDLNPEYGYPLKFYWFDEGIYVTNTIKKYEKTLYSRLVKIDGNDIEEVIEAVSSVISYENTSWFNYTVPYYITFTDILYGLDIVKDKDKAVFTFIDENGEMYDLIIKSEEFGIYMDSIVQMYEMPVYLKNKQYYYWYEYLEDENVIYFQCNKLANMESKTFDVFSEELLSIIEENSIDKLIIDLRNNTGGINGMLDTFVEKIANNSSLNKEDKLFVLVGRSTYSLGLDYAIKLSRDTEATFIGELTGENPNHFSETKIMELNNSGIIVNYSTKFIKTLDEDNNYFEPDIHVNYSIEDYKKDIDPCLEVIIDSY